MAMRARLRMAMVGLVGLLSAATLTAWQATKGTLTHEGKSGTVVVSIKHAYLVKGPDMVTGKTIRRVVLSSADVSAALKACDRMMCADGGIGEGMTIDFDADPRVNYWFVASNQRVQYSGTADPKTMKLTVDTPERVVGTWELDARPAGGPQISVHFDAALVKEIKGR